MSEIVAVILVVGAALVGCAIAISTQLHAIHRTLREIQSPARRDPLDWT